jgi:hypothetical protein
VSGVVGQWKALSDALARYSDRLSRVSTVNINSRDFREQTAMLAQEYFQSIRPLLTQTGQDELIAQIDDSFQHLLQLSHGLTAAKSYRKYTKRLRKLAPRLMGALVVNQGAEAPAEETSADDARILQTLADMVPTAAASYRQALLDLVDPNRVSFRGPALELRESLREVLDHLAPDKDVMDADGFKLEPERTQPTMKQKVRFILKARGRSKSESTVPENTANAIDGMIADLARSVYDKSSVAAHVATTRRNVGQIKRYVGALLHDILEI